MDGSSRPKDAASPDGLRVEPVSAASEAYDAVRALYKEAFPRHERYSLALLRFLARRKAVEFLAFFDGLSELRGIAYTIEAGTYLYILYLAVASNARGGGYGTAILAKLRARYPGHELVLEIEPLDKKADNYDQRVKRLAFYERNGFRLAGYDMFEGAVCYTMLATGEGFDPKEFARAVRKLTHGFLRFKIVPSEPTG